MSIWSRLFGRKEPANDAAIAQAVAAVTAALKGHDGMQNVLTRMGTPQDKRAAGVYAPPPVLNELNLDNMYGGSWLADGFREGQRIVINGITGDFKIALIRGTNATKDNVLQFTTERTLPATATGTKTITRVGAVLTFTTTNWSTPQTVELQADPFYTQPFFRRGLKDFARAPRTAIRQELAHTPGRASMKPAFWKADWIFGLSSPSCCSASPAFPDSSRDSSAGPTTWA